MYKIVALFFLLSTSIFAQDDFDYRILTYSQVGYDLALPKIAMIQHTDSTFISKNTSFTVKRKDNDKQIYKGKIVPQGKKWDKYWWKIDFSDCKISGDFYLTLQEKKQTIYTSKKEMPIKIGKELLWNQTWYKTALAHLKIRDSLSYQPEGGWKDCGSPLQEVSSHIIMLNALCDLIELTATNLTSKELDETYHQMIVGANYVVLCQDKAKEIGFQEGAVIHEMRENWKVVTGNVAKTAMILARISRLIKNKNPSLAASYLKRSISAYDWITAYGPVLHWDNSDNFAITHGAPYGMHKPPKEWMTRDLMMMMWASVELYKCGKTEYKQNAIDYANKIMARQVPKEKAEEGLYGHFYTYDSYDFTEKADIHCGAWNANYKAYNQGGHFPHYVIPFIEMSKLWSNHEDAKKWNNTVQNFAYHYFIPATNQNPFKIIPAGYYKGIGLLNWSGWYHGHNKIFGYAAALAMEFYQLYGDSKFIAIATGNLQWITGLNSGFHKNNADFSASMIVGIGNRYKEDWDAMVGTITNGFESDAQFSLEKPSKEKDLPAVFGDEGGIHHTAGWISGLTRLKAYLGSEIIK
ncbi:glycoside hydrolase family 9 protein [Flavobacterium sp. NG2]|uniref:glycoside hydrolase family 9 protein n=1 Tax=Flavobacterium sp. NG2 TaxID=3097547 RepID=UPI002A817F67|nr:glycoside hydrolase family 9 protein [Flavobacterium sp. NG2]WPR73149.1 glycoside hydrolase family 9 protein [Flavobacterium sp. NG2]